jgi:hypothetical protein
MMSGFAVANLYYNDFHSISKNQQVNIIDILKMAKKT